MTSDVTADLGHQKFMSLTTFRKSGAPVSTPTWVVRLDDGRFGLYTGSQSGKVKRLRNNPTVTMQPCDARGRVKPGAPVVSGTVELASSGPDFETVQAAIRAKYGFMVGVTRTIARLSRIGRPKFPYADMALLITPSE